jgi:hypothetical protein
MFQAFTRTLPRRYQAAAVVLGLGAVVGWGLLAGSRGVPAGPARQASAPMAESPADLRPPLPEQDKAQRPATEVLGASMASGFAQNEIARLAQEKVLVQPKPVAARPALQAASSASRPPQAGVPQAGLVARNPPTPPQAPGRRLRTAQAEAAPGDSKR